MFKAVVSDWPEQAVAGIAVSVEPAAVDAVEEVDGRHIRIGANGTAGDDEVPALVADVDAECSALVAERAVAEIADAGGDERTAIGKHLLLSRSPQAT